MLNVLPLSLIGRGLGLTYIVCVIICAFAFKGQDANWTPIYLLKIGSSVMGVLTVFIGLAATFGWKILWRYVPYLRGLYPDISGDWDVSIDWNRSGESGSVQAKAVVRQSLLRISMELEAPDSDSRTLSALPKKDPESERALLHYMYLVTPHAKSGKAQGAYHGAAILVISASNMSQMAGNYWTSHQSAGRLTMTRSAQAPLRSGTVSDQTEG